MMSLTPDIGGHHASCRDIPHFIFSPELKASRNTNHEDVEKHEESRGAATCQTRTTSYLPSAEDQMAELPLIWGRD